MIEILVVVVFTVLQLKMMRGYVGGLSVVWNDIVNSYKSRYRIDQSRLLLASRKTIFSGPICTSLLFFNQMFLSP